MTYLNCDELDKAIDRLAKIKKIDCAKEILEAAYTISKDFSKDLPTSIAQFKFIFMLMAAVFVIGMT